MKSILNSLKGDKGIWAFVSLLALFSFMPVFSASTNLAYMRHGSGNAVTYLLKHFIHLTIGFVIIYQVHKIPYNHFRFWSRFFLPVVWFLLIFVMIKGTVIEGANASRWLQVPIIGITFQPSTVAALFLYLYVARYLAKSRSETPSFQSSVFELWIPVFITLILILPSNFSTAALIFLMVLMLVFIGHYPLKYIGIIVVSGILFLTFFFILVKAFPDAFPNRVDTWISRIESFRNNKPNVDDDYQIEKAKIAIASGGIYGLGPGKSVQKNFLPQSSSDFIFAIIVEENGLIGAVGVLLIYLLLLFRFIIGARKSGTLFGKLVIVGLGFPIVFQALLNMMVAVQLIPVTGQTLPLISSGGSSIWVTCVALGIILSVTKKDDEIAQDEMNKQKREVALQKLIDKEVQENEQNNDSNYSIVENPMHAVLSKK